MCSITTSLVFVHMLSFHLKPHDNCDFRRPRKYKYDNHTHTQKSFTARVVIQKSQHLRLCRCRPFLQCSSTAKAKKKKKHEYLQTSPSIYHFFIFRQRLQSLQSHLFVELLDKRFHSAVQLFLTRWRLPFQLRGGVYVIQVLRLGHLLFGALFWRALHVRPLLPRVGFSQVLR